MARHASKEEWSQFRLKVSRHVQKPGEEEEGSMSQYGRSVGTSTGRDTWNVIGSSREEVTRTGVLMFAMAEELMCTYGVEIDGKTHIKIAGK